MQNGRFSQLVAYVTNPGIHHEGIIFECSGDFQSLLKENDGIILLWEYTFAEHSTPPRVGLLVFEGWLEERGVLDDEDGSPLPTFVGNWRELSHAEISRMRCGQVAIDATVRSLHERSLGKPVDPNE